MSTSQEPAAVHAPALPLDGQALKGAVLEACLTGKTTGVQIAKSFGWEPSDPRMRDVERILNQGEFQKRLANARRDMATYVVERFKREALLYAEVVKEIALDPKVSAKARLAAAQDALNRAGTGATQKVALDTPRAYAERLKDLLEAEQK